MLRGCPMPASVQPAGCFRCTLGTMSGPPRRRATLRFVCALAAGAGLALASVPGSFDRTLPVSGAVNLDVRSERGGVIITAGASTSVRVHAVIKPRFGRVDFDLAEANIRALEKNPPIEQAGNRIRIGYVKDQALLRAVSIRFEIEVPRTTEVHAVTESGGIRIDGITGPVETLTGSGRTEISNVGGRVAVQSQSGGIDLSSIRGAVEARNSSGSIDALRVGGSVHAETKSGAIRISQVSAAPIRAVSGSGSLKVKLASGSGYTIDALSGSGKVKGPAEIMVQRSKDTHRLRAQLGAGGPLVDLDTRSSSIDIK